LREAIITRRSEMSGWHEDRLTQELEWYDAMHDGPPNDRRVLEEMLGRWRERVFGCGPQWLADLSETERHAYSYYTKHLYGYVLAYLWPRRTPDDGAVQADTERLLASCDGTTPEVNLVYLANRVSEHLGGAHIRGAEGYPAPRRAQSIVISNSNYRMVIRPSASDRSAEDTPVERLPHLAMLVQRDGIDGAASRLSPSMNRAIYERLQTYDRRHAAKYRDCARRWRTEDERLQGELLSLHAATGRFFEVFWHYFERVPELPVDVNRDVLLAAIASTDLRMTSLLSPDAKNELEPLIFDRDGLPTAVSAVFLCKGHEVYWGTSGEVPHSSGADRSSVDLPAREHISGLYWLLIERTAISEPLREIFRDQRRRFETP
jgi:hypothetical protein